MSNAPKWVIREARPDDISFIYATWLRSYRLGSGLGLASGKSAYFHTYNRIIDHILGRDQTTALVAALADEPTVILGYLISDESALHYAFVKEPFRRMGIARALYEACQTKRPCFITHKTRCLAPVLEKHGHLAYSASHLFPETKGALDGSN